MAAEKNETTAAATRKREPYWRRARQLFENDDLDVGPTDEEVEAWAMRERSEPGVIGPTEEEKLAWALHEHRRRLARLRDRDDEFIERRSRVRGLSSREMELALLGAWDLFWEWPVRAWEDLVESGREREVEILRVRRRRRVRYYDDD